MANNLEIQPFAQPFDFPGQKRAGQEFVSGFAEAIPRLRGQVETQFGLPQMREQFLGLGETIGDISAQFRGVPGVVSGTTRESLVTAPQRERLIAQQQKPLREDLTKLFEAQGRLAPALGQAEQLAGEQFQSLLLPFQAGFSLLEQQQAREFSGYTTNNQLELNRLIGNLNAGVQLSVAEQNRLSQLAIAEAGFKNNLEQIRERGVQTRETAEFETNLANLAFSSQSFDIWNNL